MMSFSQLTEDKGGKNLHLEHIEDEILNYGVEGGRAALNFLRSLRDMLAGSSRSSVFLTQKWDGAPSLFSGIEPETGDFFVSKKSLFNVNPKLYKTNAEIDADLMLKSTRVDGVYDKDPEKDNSAVQYEEISYTDVVASKLEVMDLTAITLCEENKMPIRVFNGMKNKNIYNALVGKEIGTLIR